MGRLIESEQLKKAVRENYGSALDAALICRFIDDYAETVDAEPVRRGHWIPDFASTNVFHKYYKCSRCHRLASIAHGRNVYEDCPYCHCGAKMDGPAEVGHD